VILKTKNKKQKTKQKKKKKKKKKKKNKKKTYIIVIINVFHQLLITKNHDNRLITRYYQYNINMAISNKVLKVI